MIDTIFYFPDSLTYNDYLSKLNSDASDGIAPHVIVFAGQQKAIYLKGLRFSTNSSDIQSVVDQSRYDDTYIKGQIRSILSDVAQAQADMTAINKRINDIHQYEQSQIEDIASGVIEKSQYIKDKIAELGDKFNGYIKEEGFDDLANSWALEYIIPSVDEDGEGITFSDLVVKADIIKAAVDKLTTSIGEDGKKLQNILESYIKTTVSNDETVAEIRSAWALQEENKNVLEWMTSSYKSYASGSKTFAEILSAAQANTASGAAQKAVANLKTEIMRDINGDIKDVVSDMVSSVSTTDANNNTTVTATSIASAIASSNEAKTTLGAYFTDENKVNNLVQTKLNASVDGASWSSFVSSIKDDHTAVGNISSRVENLEGVDVVTSSMISSIVDQNGNITAAAIIAAVNGDESDVYISADKIRMEGQVYADYIAANYITADKIVSQLDKQRLTVEDGKITITSGETVTVYVPSNDFIRERQVTDNGTVLWAIKDVAGESAETSEQIVIDGDNIYNVPLHGSKSQSDVMSLARVLQTPRWRLGYDDDTFENQGFPSLANQTMYDPTAGFSVTPSDNDYYVFETSKGRSGKNTSGSESDVNAGIYIDGNIVSTSAVYSNQERTNKSFVNNVLYINKDAEIAIHKGSAATATMTIGGSNSSSQGVRLNEYYIGVTDTINIPSTESGKHYTLNINKGIITGCTLVND